MSRIGKKPIPLPDKVKVDIQAGSVVVTGPKGTVTNPLPPGIRFEKKEKELLAIRQDDSGPQRAFHGLARALVANAVRGVTEGFTRELDIVGVGFRAEAEKELRGVHAGFLPSGGVSASAGNYRDDRQADSPGVDRRRSSVDRSDRREYASSEKTGSLQAEGYPLYGRTAQEESRKGRR